MEFWVPAVLDGGEKPDRQQHQPGPAEQPARAGIPGSRAPPLAGGSAPPKPEGQQRYPPAMFDERGEFRARPIGINRKPGLEDDQDMPEGAGPEPGAKNRRDHHRPTGQPARVDQGRPPATHPREKNELGKGERDIRLFRPGREHTQGRGEWQPVGPRQRHAGQHAERDRQGVHVQRDRAVPQAERQQKRPGAKTSPAHRVQAGAAPR